MADQSKEKRKFKRYNTDMEVYFDFIYDLETKVKFELTDKKGEKSLSDKYSAFSRNISVGGICFAARRKVNQGDLLNLEVYLPGSKKSIDMKGWVAWCKPIPHSYEDRVLEEIEGNRVYEIGVRLLTVAKESVDDSIHHDAVYDVDWSIVLESVFGSYRALMEGMYKKQSE